MSEMYKQGNSLGFRFGSAIAFSTAPPTHRPGKQTVYCIWYIERSVIQKFRQLNRGRQRSSVGSGGDEVFGVNSSE